MWADLTRAVLWTDVFVKFLQRVTQKIWARHIISSASSIVLCEDVVKSRRSAASPHTASASSFRFSESICYKAIRFGRHDVTTHFKIICAIAELRRSEDEICCLLEFYTALSDNSLPTFRHKWHRYTKFHFLRLAETKCASSYVNWGAEHEHHN